MKVIKILGSPTRVKNWDVVTLRLYDPRETDRAYEAILTYLKQLGYYVEDSIYFPGQIQTEFFQWVDGRLKFAGTVALQDA